MPKTLKKIRIKAGETAENARPEDIDYVLAERLNLTPLLFSLALLVESPSALACNLASVSLRDSRAIR